MQKYNDLAKQIESNPMVSIPESKLHVSLPNIPLPTTKQLVHLVCELLGAVEFAKCLALLLWPEELEKYPQVKAFLAKKGVVFS